MRNVVLERTGGANYVSIAPPPPLLEYGRMQEPESVLGGGHSSAHKSQPLNTIVAANWRYTSSHQSTMKIDYLGANKAAGLDFETARVYVFLWMNRWIDSMRYVDFVLKIIHVLFKLYNLDRRLYFEHSRILTHKYTVCKKSWLLIGSSCRRT